MAIRLKDFMESQGITYSQFADACRIPRPSLSQILNGRNKKVSDVILRQIHTAFPSLSMLWLVFGEGPMIAVSSSVDASSQSPCAPQEEAYSQSYDASNGSVAGLSAVVPPEVRDFQRFSTPTQGASALTDREEPRKVVSITVFYDDNSYETFVPSKK